MEKTPDEIEQLAKEIAELHRFPLVNNNEYEKIDVVVAAIKGYTQCQEDMADKKYTKKDMIDFAFDTYCYISGIMKVPFNKVSENGTHAEENFKEYVKNKQN
jgi:hypothetical protein